MLRWSFLCFLDESIQQNHPSLLVDVKKHSRDAVLGQGCSHLVRAAPRDLHTGMPTGQPNSMVFLSSPMRFRSSAGSVFNQARRGSPPASVQKKMAGILFWRGSKS
jgi:hypothetical protein